MPSTNRKTRKVTPARPVSAAPQDPSSKYSPTKWGGGMEGADENGFFDLVTPSGQLCQARRPGTEGLLREGILHELDYFTALATKKMPTDRKPKGTPPADPKIEVKALLKDKSKVENVLHTIDRVVQYCVVQPEIQMAPNDRTSRQPGVVYTDMIDLEDKIYIFNWAVGGTGSAQRFRGQLDSALGDLEEE